MGLLTARVKNAERMMTHAEVTEYGINVAFADGCKGTIPFKDIPEVANPSELTRIELPNPYQINIYNLKTELVELPWDLARHYCDASYQKVVETIASEGSQSLGKRIRSIRESLGMTQSALAATAGIGRITEVRIENGEQSPRYETLMAIARALNKPLEDILTSKLSA